MSFDNWKRRLAGETVKTFLQPQFEDEGYYRKPITEMVQNAVTGHNNGQKRIIGWEPVAYFIAEGRLNGVIGDRDMAINEVTDEGLWSWVCRHPITEERYRAAERGEPWPDLSGHMRTIDGAGKVHAPPNGAEVNRAERLAVGTRLAENQPPAEEAPALPPHEEHGNKIKAAVSAASTLKVEDETGAAIALGSMNLIRDLRLAADKAGKAVYQPLHAAYKKAHGEWTPMVAYADLNEKAINKKILTFRESERRRIAAEQLKALDEQEAINERNARAADRAIANGEPEQPPEVEEVVIPQAQAPVTPTYGNRKLQEVEKWHFDGVTDFALLYAEVKDMPEVKAALIALAEKLVKAGRDVPGVKRHWGLV